MKFLFKGLLTTLFVALLVLLGDILRDARSTRLKQCKHIVEKKLKNLAADRNIRKQRMEILATEGSDIYTVFVYLDGEDRKIRIVIPESKILARDDYEKIIPYLLSMDEDKRQFEMLLLKNGELKAYEELRDKFSYLDKVIVNGIVRTLKQWPDLFEHYAVKKRSGWVLKRKEEPQFVTQRIKKSLQFTIDLLIIGVLTLGQFKVNVVQKENSAETVEAVEAKGRRIKGTVF